MHISSNLPSSLNGSSNEGHNAIIATNETANKMKKDYNIKIFAIGVGISSFVPSSDNILLQIATSEEFYYDVKDYAELEEKLLGIVQF